MNNALLLFFSSSFFTSTSVSILSFDLVHFSPTQCVLHSFGFCVRFFFSFVPFIPLFQLHDANSSIDTISNFYFHSRLLTSHRFLSFRLCFNGQNLKCIIAFHPFGCLLSIFREILDCKPLLRCCGNSRVFFSLKQQSNWPAIVSMFNWHCRFTTLLFFGKMCVASPSQNKLASERYI